jgi:RNA polymerase sigma factor (sigma-70 family)
MFTTSSRFASTLRYVRVLAGEPDRLGDGPLLARFVRHRDEAAFAELVRRHRPLVLGVARRRLADRHAAEDVFQATFLALARQAARLTRRGPLAGWLYTVASRLARKEQARAARRADLAALPPPGGTSADPLAEVSGRELLRIVDDELARLPEAYRLPVLLCGLEGLTRDEAAARLGWSLGAFRGRLERGRDLLRKRLTKRGLTVPAVLAGMLTADVAVSSELVIATSRAVLAAVPAAWGPVAALALAAGLLAAAGVGAGLALRPGDQPAPQAPAPPAVAAGPRVDRYGDPLPDGAVLRFGSSRLRHGENIYGSALSPDGKWLATAARGSVVVWDLGTGRAVHRFRHDYGFPYSRPGLTFAPDGKRLAYVHNRVFACVWDLSTGREVWRSVKEYFGKDFFSSGYCQFTSDGRELILPEGDRTVVRDLRSGAITRTMPGNWATLLTPDAETYVRVEEGKAVVIGEARTGRPLTRLDVATAHNGIQNGLAIAPDGTALAVVHQDKEIQVRDLPDGAIRVVFPLPDSARYRIRRDNKDYFEYRVGFSADGRTLLLGTVGGPIHSWDLAARAELPVLKMPPLPRLQANNMTGFHILPGGHTLVSTGADGLIRTWDLQTARERAEPEAYVGWVHAAVSPGGRHVAVADERGRVDLWDAATGKRARAIRRDGPAVANLAFAPDGRSLAAGQWTGTVQFWDVPSGREGKALRGEGGDVWTPASTLLFSPDGQCLYINDYPRRAQLWDIATGTPRWQARTDFGAAFAPDGSTLVASRDGPSMAFVDAATGAERRTVRLNSEQSDRLGTFRPVAVAPDGRLVAAALVRTSVPNATALGFPSWPSNRRTSWPVSTSQMRTAISLPPVASQ